MNKVRNGQKIALNFKNLPGKIIKLNQELVRKDL